MTDSLIVALICLILQTAAGKLGSILWGIAAGAFFVSHLVELIARFYGVSQ